MRHDYSLDVGKRGASGGRRKPIEIVMTPMIDVIFLLLVFFLATSSFQVVEKLMPSGVSKSADSTGNAPELPPEVTDDAIEQIKIQLRSSPTGAIALMNGVALSEWGDLKTRLQQLSQVRNTVPVIIDPESSVTAKYVVQAYDWSRQAGLDRVYLAIRE